MRAFFRQHELVDPEIRAARQLLQAFIGLAPGSRRPAFAEAALAAGLAPATAVAPTRTPAAAIAPAAGAIIPSAAWATTATGTAA
jgi:hypothetical protein